MEAVEAVEAVAGFYRWQLPMYLVVGPRVALVLAAGIAALNATSRTPLAHQLLLASLLPLVAALGGVTLSVGSGTRVDARGLRRRHGLWRGRPVAWASVLDVVERPRRSGICWAQLAGGRQVALLGVPLHVAQVLAAALTVARSAGGSR